MSAQASSAGARNRHWLRQIPGILWALLGSLALLGFLSPRSVQPIHLLDVTRQSAALIIAATGQTLVILTGGIDLSVGAVITLVEVLAAQMINNRAGLALPVAALGLIVGALIGLVNGLVVTRLRVAPFIATLGMSIMALGGALVYSGGAPRGGIPEGMRFWGTGFVMGHIPAAAIVWLAVVTLIGLVLSRTGFGRKIYAVGANARTAFLSGIDSDRIKVSTYVLSGTLAALAGLELAAYVGTGSLTIGDDYMLNTIAAVILGGAAFTGGKGSLVATVIACLFLYILFSILTVLNMAQSGRLITQGVVIVAAIALQTIRK